MTDKTLKPCPFCGGEASIMHRNEQSRLIFSTGDELSTCYITECKSCLARVQRGFKDDAIKAWNTRTDKHTLLNEAIERIKAIDRDISSGEVIFKKEAIEQLELMRDDN